MLLLDHDEIRSAGWEPQRERVVLEELARTLFADLEQVGVCAVSQDPAALRDLVESARKLLRVKSFRGSRGAEEKHQDRQ
ncbi:MAG: hypothetical protein VCC67_08310 [Myxococcota bacterium]